MLTMNDIVTEGHPALRMKAERVDFPMSADLIETAEAMLEFLKNSQDEELAKKYQLRAGVGLAAPQINVNKQIFAMQIYHYDDEGNQLDEEMSQIFVNPIIIRHSIEIAAISEGEGCLSVNREVPGLVPRPKRVTIEYQDLQGEKHILKLRNFQAMVAQHEIDHLNGVMFYDHINQDQPWMKNEDWSIL